MTRRTRREAGTSLLAMCFLLAQVAGSLHYVAQPHTSCAAHQTPSHAEHHCTSGPGCDSEDGIAAPRDHAGCTVTLAASLCAPPVIHASLVVAGLAVPAGSDPVIEHAARADRRWLLAPKNSPPA